MKRFIKGNVFFYFFSVTAVLLIIVSFITPPPFIVDNSILAAVGELFSFSALGVLLHSIDKGYDAKISKGNTTLEITNDENKEE